MESTEQLVENLLAWEASSQFSLMDLVPMARREWGLSQSQMDVIVAELDARGLV